MSSEPDETKTESDASEPGGGEAREDSRLYKKVTHFNEFIDDAAKGVTDAEFKVWMVIFRFANNGVARVSKKTIAEVAGKSERQVGRDIKTLIEKGLLKISDEHDGYKRRGNEYRLGIKALPKLPRAKKPSKNRIPDAPDSNPTASTVEPDPALEFFARKPK